MILKQLIKGTFLSLILILSACGSAQEEKKPNIVVILCDDLGYGDLSSYGHQIIKTPNIDKLANTGIRLTNFYASAPVCSPSRAGLLTGRSPNRAGIYDFIIGGRKKRENNRDMVHLQKDEETIPAMLKGAGYNTCLSGKWHCSSLFNQPEKQPTPDQFGFDHWFSTQNNASPTHENPKNFVRNGEDVGVLEGFSCQLVVDEAVDWLKKQEKETPFYLQVNFHEPHEPIASPKDLVAQYMPFSKSEYEAQFYANVANVDKAVGRLISYLDEHTTGNTLVIFTSDNGPETLNRYERAFRSFGTTGGLKGMKLWTTEAGFRVPGIINWRGKSGYTGTSDAVISALDFLPTFAELTGAALPKNELDGESFASFLTDGTFTRKKPLIWSFYNALNDRVVAMRDGDWKIMAQLKNKDGYLPKILNVYDGNEAMLKESELADFVLYNLKNDVAEASDVSEKYPAEFKEMKENLKKEYEALLAGSHIWKRDE